MTKIGATKMHTMYGSVYLVKKASAETSTSAPSIKAA